MSGPDPSSIIREFRERPESYRQASEKEGEVWGETFSNAQKKILFDEDRQAADRLRPTRGLGLRAVLRERNLTFESGLSLACGAGRAEREFLRQGICKRFQGIDISDRAIEEARRLAADLPLTYEVADLNHVTLAENSYDLVTTSSCLHHVLELEHLAEQIWRSLRPGGYLWIHDYVGETQFQYSDRRLAVVNRLLAALPERYRRQRLRGGQVMDTFNRPVPGKLVSPFEAIRSAEIMPVFTRWFDIEFRNEQNSFMALMCGTGTRANYTETEDGPALFELLMAFDALLIENGVLGPHTGLYLMRRREFPET